MAVSDRRILTALDKRIQALMSGPDAPKELTEDIVTSLVPDVAVDVMAAFRAIKPVIQKLLPSVLESWRNQPTAVVADTPAPLPPVNDSSQGQLIESSIEDAVSSASAILDGQETKQSSTENPASQAIALWLVDNTALTFGQIGNYCGLTEDRVQAIADGEVANGITAIDPVANQQLTAQEIERCQQDPSARLVQNTKIEPAGDKTTGSAVPPVSDANSPVGLNGSDETTASGADAGNGIADTSDAAADETADSEIDGALEGSDEPVTDEFAAAYGDEEPDLLADVGERPVLATGRMKDTLRLDYEPFAKRYLGPLIAAFKALDPPAIYYPEVEDKLIEVGEGWAIPKVPGIFAGTVPLLIRPKGHTVSKFSGVALALVAACRSRSSIVYAEIMKGRNVRISSHANGANGAAKPVTGLDVTWADFARVVPHVAALYKEHRNVDSLSGLLDCTRKLFTTESGFNAGLNDLVATGEVYDRNNASLKPFPTAIAYGLNLNVPAHTLYPEREQTRQRIISRLRELHEAFVDVVAHAYLRVGGERASKRLAPGFDRQGNVEISPEFHSFLYGLVPMEGRRGSRYTSSQNMERLLADPFSIFEKGKLAPPAARLLELLKVDQDTIDKTLSLDPRPSVPGKKPGAKAAVAGNDSAGRGPAG